MKNDLLSRLSDHAARERARTATVLSYIAELDARRLYLEDGHSSMDTYCVEQLHMDEDDAFVRVRVARTARRFPAIFEAIADGRLRLEAALLLTPYLTDETADELIAAATHKSQSELQRLLAERFPRPEGRSEAAAAPTFSFAPTVEPHAPGHVEPPPETVERPDPGSAEESADSGRR